MLYTLIAIVSIVGFLVQGSLFLMPRIRRMEEGRARDLFVLQQVQGIFRRLLKRCRVQVEVQGIENIPEDEAVLFIGNHRSFFDVIIGYTLPKVPTGFVAKIEIQKLKPLVRWMELLHCLFIDRKNMKQSLKVILEAIRQIKGGTCVWIYPEGTRSKGADPAELLPFKEGSFKIAEKTGCRVVPVAMVGTSGILEEHFPWVRPGKVRVSVGKPFLISELEPEERERVGEYTRGRIITMIREMQQEEAGEYTAWI